MTSQLLRYLIVGAVNTGIGLACIFSATYFLGLGDVQANVTGYAVGILFSYGLHRFWTFEYRGAVGRSLSRFVLVFAFAYGCNLLTMLLVHRVVDMNLYLSQSFGVLVYVAVGFLGSRSYAFSRS
jgi:putative flippase GtrA